MGRRSMDELLTAFDPLHSSNGGASSATAAPQTNSSPLFPEPTASTTPASSTKSSDIQHIATARHHAPISLSQAPLDLLSFDEHNDEYTSHASNSASLKGPHNIISSHSGGQVVSQSAAFPSVQAKAAQRQENLLQELHNADQPFNTHIGSALSNQGIAASPPTGPTPRQRRPSSGFSPPRRMSRSGLMHDEHIPQIRAQHAHTTSSGQHSPTMEILGHVPASPSTRVSDEPAVLFHPSSPPSGSTIDSLRQNSYFPNVGRPGGSGIPPPPPPAQSIFDRPVATSDRQRRTSSSDRQAFHTLNDGTSSSGQSVNSAPSAQPESRKPSGSRAAFIQNALRGPPPPFSSPSLKQSTSSHSQPIPGPSQAPGPIPVPHSNSPSQSAPPPSSPGSKPKSFRKPTFDFPSFSSLGSSVSSSGRSQTLPQPAVHIKDERRSGSTTPSPASSLIIDSDPLPPLVLKVTGAARDSKRVLTEDIADGIRMALPPRIKLCKSWTLLYSLDAHGTSLTTLYTRVQAGLQKSTGGCVLVVQDMDGGIFGAYVNEAFKKSESYYGNGECFLWKVESFPPGDNFRVGPIVRPFRWTARNDYIILSDSGFLSVGGGDGKFGLWLDSSFDKGFTTSCPAFANEPLCSPSLIRNGVDGNPEGKFEIMAVECWAVG